MEFDSLIENSPCGLMPKAPRLTFIEDSAEDVSFLQLSAYANDCSQSSASCSDIHSYFNSGPEIPLTSHKASNNNSMFLFSTHTNISTQTRIKRVSQSCKARIVSFAGEL
eukprot:TRINITY_DN16569_c0_g1_i1.p1 TRINITY_DN16569_c0_g1~~TRINITY_DN16569_c0_g1_i1.p1  ORF type:complete len:110 (+),score=7.12 TRINITY_DN16569_c0_g1_i1:137-466(+)